MTEVEDKADATRSVWAVLYPPFRHHIGSVAIPSNFVDDPQYWVDGQDQAERNVRNLQIELERWVAIAEYLKANRPPGLLAVERLMRDIDEVQADPRPWRIEPKR